MGDNSGICGCYNRSKFGLLQLTEKIGSLTARCYNRSKFGLLQQTTHGVRTAMVVITVQNSVFYNGKAVNAHLTNVVITVQNSVFYNFDDNLHKHETLL